MNQTYLRQTIEKAILDRRWLRMDFVSSKMKITKGRVIEPMRLKVKNGEDYVEAHCYLRNDYREFPLIGIQKIEIISPADYNKGVKIK
jgi:predicted DNA-binding transcriptional regulator YafY